MRNFFAFAGLPLLLAAADASAALECNSRIDTNPPRVVYLNRDCVEILVEVLERGELPEIDGVRVPARLVYDLPRRDLFPTIRRLLEAARERKLKLEIGFAIGESDAPDEITDLEVDVTERPPSLRR